MNDLFSMKGRVAVVTGAVGLLGRQHCHALSYHGAHIVVSDLDETRSKEFAETLPTESIGAGTDVTDPDSLAKLLARTLDHFGRLDILVNNAAVNDALENPALREGLSRFETYPLTQWRRSMEVNVTGVFLCCQVLGSHMAAQRTGSIINIASTYGIVAPDQSIYRRPDGDQSFHKSAVYAASKGAVIAFTRFLATYWGSAGVRVNCLSPGGVENGQEGHFIRNYSLKTPLGSMAAATDFKGAIVFLASDASSYMTGANLVVDGGWTIW